MSEAGQTIISHPKLVNELLDAKIEIDRLRALSQNNAHSWDMLVAERNRLRAEVERLEAVQSSCHRDIIRLSDEIDHLRAENERLRELLREYGGHADGCDGKFGEAYRCRCRWNEESAILA